MTHNFTIYLANGSVWARISEVLLIDAMKELTQVMVELRQSPCTIEYQFK